MVSPNLAGYRVIISTTAQCRYNPTEMFQSPIFSLLTSPPDPCLLPYTDKLLFYALCACAVPAPARRVICYRHTYISAPLPNIRFILAHGRFSVNHFNNIEFLWEAHRSDTYGDTDGWYGPPNLFVCPLGLFEI